MYGTLGPAARPYGVGVGMLDTTVPETESSTIPFPGFFVGPIDINGVGAARREARPGRRFSLLPIEKNELLHIPATALIHLITDKLPVGEQFQKEIQSAHHPGFRQTAGNLLPGIATPLSSFP